MDRLEERAPKKQKTWGRGGEIRAYWKEIIRGGGGLGSWCSEVPRGRGKRKGGETRALGNRMAKGWGPG